MLVLSESGENETRNDVETTRGWSMGLEDVGMLG